VNVGVELGDTAVVIALSGAALVTIFGVAIGVYRSRAGRRRP
jgi:hypothetical protein